MDKTFKQLGFNVGDKVRCTKSDYADYKEGKEYTLVEFSGEPSIDGRWNGYAGEWELVSEREYEVGKVYLWRGGECPLPKETQVKICYGDKQFNSSCWRDYSLPAENLNWQHDFVTHNVIMFKVVSYPEEKKTVSFELTDDQIKAVKAVLQQCEGKEL